MKPKLVILRHPGTLSGQAMENIRNSCRDLFGPTVKAMVLCEGMQAWLVGDGKVYDLNNSGELVDGQFHSIAVEALGENCCVEWKPESREESENP